MEGMAGGAQKDEVLIEHKYIKLYCANKVSRSAYSITPNKLANCGLLLLGGTSLLALAAHKTGVYYEQ